jgi:hypothetical protein
MTGTTVRWVPLCAVLVDRFQPPDGGSPAGGRGSNLAGDRLEGIQPVMNTGGAEFMTKVYMMVN